MQLVSWPDFGRVLGTLVKSSDLAVDAETTALSPHTGRLIGFAIASPHDSYYFDFNGTLDRKWIAEVFAVLNTDDRLWVNHHIKLDLGFLRREGVEIKGPVWCTQAMARIEYNDHMQYSLEACGERIGFPKDDRVKKYLEENGLYTWITIPGKKTRIKEYHFDKIPLDILWPYACRDTEVAMRLFEKQRKFATEAESESHKGTVKPIWPVVKLEMATTKAVLDMEYHGIKVNREYCALAAAHEQGRIGRAQTQFRVLTGQPLVDSAKSLAPIFARYDIKAGVTKKGNDSFTDEVLEAAKLTFSPNSDPGALLCTLQEYRDANKRLGTYFSSFIYHSRSDGRIHCNLNPAGAATARFSASSPNLQNLSEEEDILYPIRRAFEPDDDCDLLSADYSGMEYTVMLNYACSLVGYLTPLGKLVKGGMNVHRATAQLASEHGIQVAYKDAKISNFLTIYGGGPGKLAQALGCTLDQAKAIREAIFTGAPEIRVFMDQIRKTADKRGYVYNWLGRRYHFPFKTFKNDEGQMETANFSYAAPNYVVQGGCADIMRRVLVAVRELLQGKRSRMHLPIHDELVLSIHHEERHLIAAIKAIMVAAYQAEWIPLGVGLHLGKNLHDMEVYNG